MPCAGRRKREANVGVVVDNEVLMDHETGLHIEPTASIALIVGTTTLTDPLVVSEYLVAHQPSSQSIIYPADITISEIQALQEDSPKPVDNVPSPTELYPSNDSPDQDVTTILYDEPQGTTETPIVPYQEEEEVEEEEATTPQESLEIQDRARVGLGKITTVTTVIRVTSVATSLATGMMATLTVMYAGCMPPSLPITGVPGC